MRFWTGLALAAVLFPRAMCFAAATPAADPAVQATDLYHQGKRTEAFALIEQIITANPKKGEPFYIRGLFYMEEKQPGKAVDSFNKAIELDPKLAAYQKRGEANFELGRFRDSLNDFNKVIELDPGQRRQHWQRGISCYYARQYEEGRKQFELHRQVNPNDVENAVWHYLCVAKISGVERAQSLLIPMSGDPRVPMKEVYALFGGKAKPEDVLNAAKEGPPSPRLNGQIFYADLYVGLWHEAQGHGKEARFHILKAASEAPDDYMGIVAKVHARVLDKTRPD